jgi:hypothetical protein
LSRIAGPLDASATQGEIPKTPPGAHLVIPLPGSETTWSPQALEQLRIPARLALREISIRIFEATRFYRFRQVG